MSILFKLISSFFSALPLPAALAVGRGLGWFLSHVIRHRRNECMQAMMRCIPEMPISEARKNVDKMYANLGMNIVEAFRLGSVDQAYVDKYISMPRKDILDKEFERGRGVIGLTAHYGNWEQLACFPPPLGLPRLHIVVKKVRPESLNTHLVALRSHFHTNVLHRKGASRGCIKALKSNEFLGFIFDQNAKRNDGVFVDFFGQTACTTQGLAQLASIQQSSIVPVFDVRKPGGYHEQMVLDPIEPPRDRSEEEILRVTQECTKVIEQVIRERPDHWIWLHRRWRTQPKPPEEQI